VIALDTNVLVASLLEAHADHEVACGALEATSDAGLLVPAPVLFEAYSVLTRLPRPHRLAPKVALAALRGTLGGSAIAGVDAAEVWRDLADAVEHGISGGAVHDFAIGRCAVRGKATTLLTFNDRHFQRYFPELTVVVPT
jgi:predicted nucleic acid-binding protein